MPETIVGVGDPPLEITTTDRYPLTFHVEADLTGATAVVNAWTETGQMLTLANDIPVPEDGDVVHLLDGTINKAGCLYVKVTITQGAEVITVPPGDDYLQINVSTGNGS